jgi:hypothetical protein
VSCRHLAWYSGGVPHGVLWPPHHIGCCCCCCCCCRLFPRSRRSENYTMGVLRVLSRVPARPGRQEQQQHQQQQQQPLLLPTASSQSTASCQSSQGARRPWRSEGSGGVAAVAGADDLLHQQQSCGSADDRLPPLTGTGGLSPTNSDMYTPFATPGEAGTAAAAAAQAAFVPLSHHPNMATAGSPATVPLGVLQLTIQVQGLVLQLTIQVQGLSAGHQPCPHWCEMWPFHPADPLSGCLISHTLPG